MLAHPLWTAILSRPYSLQGLVARTLIGSLASAHFCLVAHAAECNLSGKTINFNREICFHGAVRNGNCIYGPVKMKIIGRSLLYYSDVAENIGVEYVVGEQRDLLKDADPVQRQELLRNRSLPNTTVTIFGSVSYTNGVLTIETHTTRYTLIPRTMPNSSLAFNAGEAFGTDETVESFTIDGSCNRCSVQGFRGETRILRGPILERETMGNSSCSID